MPRVAQSIGDDLADRLRKALDDLSALRRELDHSQQLATLGILTAGIAHEINNILTPVLAYAQLAKSNPRDDALRNKALDRAIAGVEAASRINQAVLGMSRQDSDVQHAQVQEVVDVTLACMGRDPARDGIKVVVDVDPAAWVRMSPLALQQVLLNLVLNALNALHGRPGEVRISADEHRDGTTRIHVADTGPGVPADLARRIFEPFVSGYTGSRKPPTGHGGSGLGLAVCRRLVEDTGGTIVLNPDSIRRADREPGGATFTITLPTHVRVPSKTRKAG